MMKKEKVCWEGVECYVEAVASEFKKRSNTSCTGVYGLPRGGLVLAVMLSHRLNVPLLMSPAEDCIIVDDICDSGESLLHYVNNSSGNCKHRYFITTLYGNKNAAVQPDYYFKEKPHNTWIVFPWEHE